MGYTHYWKVKNGSEESFKEFSDTCKKLHDALPKTTDSAGGSYSNERLKIGNGLGEGKPEFTDEIVRFNGDAKHGLNHETFSIAKNDDEWNFCKTARKPYDLLVVACLLAAVDFLGYKFSSDGFTDYNGKKDVDDLLPALEFYNRVMNTNYTENHLWKIREDY